MPEYGLQQLDNRSCPRWTKGEMGMSDFVAPSASRLRVMRGGRAVVRGWKIPKPVALVDTREQTPFLLAAEPPELDRR